MTLSKDEIDIMNDYKRDVGLSGGDVYSVDDIVFTGSGIFDVFKNILSVPIGLLKGITGSGISGCKYCERRQELCDVCEKFYEDNHDKTALELNEIEGGFIGNLLSSIIGAPMSIVKKVLGMGVDDNDNMLIGDVINSYVSDENDIEGSGIIDTIKNLVKSVDKQKLITDLGGKLIDKYGKKILGMGNDNTPIELKPLKEYKYQSDLDELELELNGGDVLDIVRKIANISPFTSDFVDNMPLTKLIGKDTVINLAKKIFKQGL